MTNLCFKQVHTVATHPTMFNPYSQITTLVAFSYTHIHKKKQRPNKALLRLSNIVSAGYAEHVSFIFFAINLTIKEMNCVCLYTVPKVEFTLCHRLVYESLREQLLTRHTVHLLLLLFTT